MRTLGPFVLRAYGEILSVRRDILLTITIDKQSVQWLRQLAEAETEGNRSLLIRNLIRQAARTRCVSQGEPVAERASNIADAGYGAMKPLKEVGDE